MPDKDVWQREVIEELIRMTPRTSGDKHLKGNPAALAQLRRYRNGILPNPEAGAPILKLIPHDVSANLEGLITKDVLLIGSLYAHHRIHSDDIGNIGATLGRHADNSSINNYFTRLLRAERREHLNYMLYSTIDLISTFHEPVNYIRLLNDIGIWGNRNYRQRLRENWYNSYTRAPLIQETA